MRGRKYRVRHYSETEKTGALLASKWGWEVKGDRIIKLRNHLGISQSDLARQSGVPASTLSLLESRRRSVIQSDGIVALCATLQTHADYLLGMSPDPHPHTDEELPEQALRIAWLVAQISDPQTRQAVLAAAEAQYRVWAQSQQLELAR